MHSLDKLTLEKSLEVLKPGGRLISITGPPDPDFARDIGASWMLKAAISLLSYGVRIKAKRQKVNYSLLFMRANGDQLTEITRLIAPSPIFERTCRCSSRGPGAISFRR